MMEKLHITIASNVREESSYGGSTIEPLHASSGVIPTVVLTGLFSFILIASTLLNTLFLIVFYPKTSLRNISNRFIVSLAISNLLSSCLLLPVAIADIFLDSSATLYSTSSSITDYLPQNILCTVFIVLADFATSSAVFSTILIAIDRYIAISNPLHYHMLVTKGRSYCFMATGWILSTIIATVSGIVDNGRSEWNVCRSIPSGVSEIKWSQTTFTVSCFFFTFLVPFIVLSWAYSQIYSAAQQNSERARRSSIGTQPTQIIDPLKTVSRSSSTRSTSSQIVSTIRRRISNASLFLYREEARAAKISASVVVLFLVSWLPYFGAKIVFAFVNEENIPQNSFKVIIFFASLNSLVSTYIYMYRSKRIQKEVLKLFGISLKHRRNDIERHNPPYHQLRVNLEKIPASPLNLDGAFKLETFSKLNSPDHRAQKKGLAQVLEKIFETKRPGLKLSTSSECISSVFVPQITESIAQSCVSPITSHITSIKFDIGESNDFPPVKSIA